ncbi:hypothetical protein C5167_014691 [Papaver somniferum]|uniref:Uncharacterized protein n=1 Tax=Papaver somniferum TaxID=3469 RepID=A0A4Y7J895_PAPSO|nr:hypothetical protein C5167_014691 [Papaver somniferum]
MPGDGHVYALLKGKFTMESFRRAFVGSETGTLQLEPLQLPSLVKEANAEFQASSVGIFPYVLKVLQTTAVELSVMSGRSGEAWWQEYFIRFLDGMDAYPEQCTMTAFVLAVIMDSHRRGQESRAKADLIHMCLRHLHPTNNTHNAQSEPLLLQWLCLFLGPVVSPEVALLQALLPAVITFYTHLLQHTNFKPLSNSLLGSLPSLANITGKSSGYPSTSRYMQPGGTIPSLIGPVLRVGSDHISVSRDGSVSTSSPIATL